MNPVEVQELFERHGAILNGHFKLSSGRHSDTYVQCARILEHPRIASSLAQALSTRCTAGVDVVVSPALGGVLIGYLVAHELGCRFLFTERVDGAMALRRGQALVPGERFLVVEDVITTGGSAAEVIALGQQGGGVSAGVASLIDRSEQQPAFHLEALLRVPATSWDPADCSFCRRGEPLHTPGSR
ncbi:MAG: orotate phosphoribosyltransferase, partial [Chloroflexi bacterium]|nr:orotate phosphoribosyltransferase [Chloroflexota bacterium]